MFSHIPEQQRDEIRQMNGEHMHSQRTFGATTRAATMAILFCTALACASTTAHAATARTAFDGSWDLVFVTRSGDCDPTYNFTVNVANGIVSHPNLVRFTGRVGNSG